MATFVSQLTPIIVILWKENKNLQKKGQICKIHENWFYENWLFQEERPFEEKKTVVKSKWYFKREMMLILYRDAYLQFNRNKIGRFLNLSFFLLKTDIFKIHSQQKLSTNRVDSLSGNYLEN